MKKNYLPQQSFFMLQFYHEKERITMPTYYDEKTKTWFCQFRYTDSNGNKKQKRKRGFKTKKEAKEFERDFLATQQQSLEMKFSQFLVLYNEDMSTRLKPKTILVKEYIIKKHILPYFEKPMNKRIKTWLGK